MTGRADISRRPVGSSSSTSFATHRLIERVEGLELRSGSNGPLYFGVFFLLLAPAAWYLTRDLEIDPGLKLAAWLFPLFAGTPTVIMYAVMRTLGSRVVFDTMAEEVRISGLLTESLRFQMKDLIAVQTCYDGEARTRDSSWQKFELNLVYDSGGAAVRRCILCHAARGVIESQARTIADRLRVDLIECIEENMAAEPGGA